MNDATPDDQRAKTTHPPYVSFATFKTCIGDLKEHGLPTRIDRSVLTRFSGITGTQLMTALRFLQLMDQSGKPTEFLRALINAHGTDDWAPRLKTILVLSYEPVFDIDLSAATPKEFSETFSKAFPGAESVLRKCIAFFLPAAKDAGVVISQRILASKKPRNPNGPQRRKPAKPAGAAPAPAGEAGTAAKRDVKPPADPKPEGSSSFMDQLLAKFPPFDPGWAPELKAEWFKSFQQFMGYAKAGEEQK